MVSRSRVTSADWSRPEIFCCVFSGRRSRSLMLLVGQTRVSEQNRSRSSCRSRRHSSNDRPGSRLAFAPGTDGTLGQADPHRVAELADQWAGDVGGEAGLAAVEGLVPAALSANLLCGTRPPTITDMRAGMETPRRDRDHARCNASPGSAWAGVASSMVTVTSGSRHPRPHVSDCCLLYTSDAADEEDSVDLGGRRIIK